MFDDLRTALRSLRVSPTFTAVALTVLALGIGAGTAIFSVVDAVVLRGLPFDEHDRIVAVLEHDTRRPETFGGGRTTAQTYLDWRRLQESFEAIAGVESGGPLQSRSETGEPVESQGLRVTHEFFPVFRVQPILGRAFTEDDSIEGRNRVAIISYGYWLRRFGGSPDAIGKTIEVSVDALGQTFKMNTQDFTVVGIVGDIRHLGLEAPPRPESYAPLAQNTVIGVTLVMRTRGDALAALPAVTSAIWSVNKEQRIGGDVFTLEQYMDRLIAQRRFNMTLLTLFGVLGLVIAVVGIYGVMAYIVAQRTNEIGVRMALGATRGHVVAIVLRRAGMMMAVGLALGGVIAWYASAAVRVFLFETEPNDVATMAAALAVLTAAGLLASAVPARRAASVDPLIALRHE